MSALPLPLARLSKLRIPFQNNFLDWALCKMSLISTFCSFFLVFKRDFIRRADFTLISASNTASDDVAN